jgi:hypothetical protein
MLPAVSGSAQPLKDLEIRRRAIKHCRGEPRHVEWNAQFKLHFLGVEKATGVLGWKRIGHHGRNVE